MKRLLVCLGALALAVLTAAAGPPPRVKNDVQFKGTFFHVNEVSEAPVLMDPVKPIYPHKMWLNHVSGQAEIAFIVNAKGKTEEVQIASATNQPFGDAARVAVEKWRFKPGKKDGQPVRTAITQVIPFDRP